ncbi:MULTISPECIES: hypothetical protein [Burkholderia cepacia complex]|uniref:RiboL-PSP-HEPN domain-containing protein n=1 Tax=Burkholderia stagnalis TaxID=1503054 RepID=A0A6L3N4W1_9BURK|nr:MULTISPECIES: hypothetical protein [Burkholderia cepacia complex]KAB0641565.1 hypothetical protein F7R25_00545 [Burkholderia stagnalis]MBR8089893.1 hypothetical protein [Burkholderia cenocepacia]
MQQLETYAHFQCPSCGAHSSDTIILRIPSPCGTNCPSEFYDGDQPAELACRYCGKSFEADVYLKADTCVVELQDHPRTYVEAGELRCHESKSWAIWDDIPVNPFDIYLDSYHQMHDLLLVHGEEDGGDIVNRMIFVQQMSAFEAYLGDTLLSEVKKSKIAITNLLTRDRVLKNASFTLREIFENSNFVMDCVVSHLKGIVYHRLDTVDFLYRVSLDVRIWPDDGVRDELFRSVEFRNDCAHRNGYDRNGQRLDVFTPNYVQRISDCMKAVVEHIQSQVINRVK